LRVSDSCAARKRLRREGISVRETLQKDEGGRMNQEG
jgi:hypothetical protein